MEPIESIRRLDILSGGYQRSLVLFAAVRSGVFEHLRRPSTAQEIAQAMGWHIRGARMLLDGLVALELLRKSEHRYQNTPTAETCLVPGAPHDQRAILLHRANALDQWLQLEQVLRTGHGPREQDRTGDALRAFICGMDNIARESALALLQKVDLAPYRRLLDVGGGPGTYSRVFLQKHPQMSTVILDLAPVLEIAGEFMNQAALQDRVRYHTADMTRDPFPTGFDLVLLSNVIHSFDPDTNRNILRKCHDALTEGGLLIVKDFLMDAERTGPPFSLMFALHMFVCTENGDTYTLNDVADWTSEVGFLPGEYVALTPQTRLWLVRRAGASR